MATSAVDIALVGFVHTNYVNRSTMKIRYRLPGGVGKSSPVISIKTYSSWAFAGKNVVSNVLLENLVSNVLFQLSPVSGIVST